MLVLGTTVSLVLTFGTAWLIDKHQRAKDRRLTALMVTKVTKVHKVPRPDSRSLTTYSRYDSIIYGVAQ